MKSTIRGPNRALLPFATVLVLLAAIMTQGLLSPLRASADPALTQNEITYVTLLAQGPPNGDGGPIVPIPGSTHWDLAQGGHAIAYDLRNGVSPQSEVDWIYRHTGPDFTYSMAEWEVVCAIVVFAPEFIPPDVPNGGFQT